MSHGASSHVAAMPEPIPRRHASWPKRVGPFNAQDQRSHMRGKEPPPRPPSAMPRTRALISPHTTEGQYAHAFTPALLGTRHITTCRPVHARVLVLCCTLRETRALPVETQGTTRGPVRRARRSGLSPPRPQPLWGANGAKTWRHDPAHWRSRSCAWTRQGARAAVAHDARRTGLTSSIVTNLCR